MTKLKKLVVLVLIAGVLAGGGYWLYQKKGNVGQYQTSYEKDSEYVRFSMEIFDIIRDNYWQKVNESDLVDLYRLSFAKAASTTPQNLATTTREEIASMLSEGFDRVSADKRKELAVNTNIIALANLTPQGRSGLLSNEQETAFRDNVNNVDRGTDLYAALDLKEGASVEEVKSAYEEKVTELKADKSSEAQEKLAQAERAKSVLGDEGSKAIYDETKSEPTLSSNKITGGILYLDLTKISNTTLQEVANLLGQYSDKNPLNGLIIDVRGNAGGALDFARYFMSMFFGPNQYVYDYFHQGELVPERTPNFAKVDTVSGLKNVAILTDGDSQSTAELLTAIFKRFKLGKSIGTQTKGWGTVENTFPIKTELEGGKYSVLLVHSLTLRDDGEPIEGRGVDPDVDISKSGWQTSVRSTFSSKNFADSVINILNK